MQRYVIDYLKELDEPKYPNEAHIVYCNENNLCYSWNVETKEYKELEMDPNVNFGMNLYDLNKNIISQLESLTNAEIIEKVNTVIENFRIKTYNNFYMLLCRDFNYYTLFAKGEGDMTNFSNTVMEIITELGDIYSIEETSENIIEIWIKPVGEESPLAFYLFPYENGVVYYG